MKSVHGPNLRTVGRILVLIFSGFLLRSQLHADTVTYIYDANGRLISAYHSGAGVTYNYTYDKSGNLIGESVITGPTFALQVTISPAGGGSVTGGGLTCPSLCAKLVQENLSVSLTANAQTGFDFLAWGGDGSGTASPLSFDMNAAKNIIAYFGSSTGGTDGDGATDSQEMGLGGTQPDYDGNGNGIPDYQEASAASLPTSEGDAYATLSAPSGQILTGVRAVGNPSPADMPAGLTFPYGFFEFTVERLSPGGCTTVTLYLPVNDAIITYYKYGPTPDNHVNHWYPFMYDGTTGAQIFHEPTGTRVVLHLCDGQRGDDDLLKNGVVVDQGGPAGESGQHPVPTLTDWVMILFAALLGLGSALQLRRPRTVI